MRLTRRYLVLILIVFFISELIARLFVWTTGDLLNYDNSYNGWRAKPGSPHFWYRINSQGFNDIEHSKTKTPNTYRIICLGDSFVFSSVPYDRNFTTLIGKQISQKHHTSVEVINMGIPFSGPSHYLSLLKNEGLSYSPDHLLVCIYTGNDLLEYTQPKRKPLIYSFFVINKILRIIWAVPFRGKYQTQLRPIGDYPEEQHENPTFSVSFYKDVCKNILWIFNKTNETLLQKHISGVMRDLLKMHEECLRRNIFLTVIIAPSELQVDQKLQQETLSNCAQMERANYDFDLPSKLLSKELKNNNIEYIDLATEFARSSNYMPNNTLYKIRDTHWNVTGNRVAAEIITNKITIDNNK